MYVEEKMYIKCNNLTEYENVQMELVKLGYCWNSGSHFFSYKLRFPMYFICLENMRLLYDDSEEDNFKNDKKTLNYNTFIRKIKLNRLDVKNR